MELVMCHTLVNIPNVSNTTLFTCGVKNAMEDIDFRSLMPMFQQSSLPQHPRRYIEALVLYDDELIGYFSNKVSNLRLTMIDVIGYANLLHAQLNVHLVMSEIRPYNSIQLNYGNTLSDLLESLANANVTDETQFDTVIFITGHFYLLNGNQQTHGVAYLNGICTKISINVLAYAFSLGGIGSRVASSNSLATTLAHELGHTLGLVHDSEAANKMGTSCECGDNNTVTGESHCIMVASAYDLINAPTKWSNCNEIMIESQLATKECLDYPNQPPVNLLHDICGNGVIELDEECECSHGDTECEVCCDLDSCTVNEICMDEPPEGRTNADGSLYTTRMRRTPSGIVHRNTKPSRGLVSQVAGVDIWIIVVTVIVIIILVVAIALAAQYCCRS